MAKQRATVTFSLRAPNARHVRHAPTIFVVWFSSSVVVSDDNAITTVPAAHGTASVGLKRFVEKARHHFPGKIKAELAVVLRSSSLQSIRRRTQGKLEVQLPSVGELSVERIGAIF